MPDAAYLHDVTYASRRGVRNERDGRRNRTGFPRSPAGRSPSRVTPAPHTAWEGTPMTASTTPTPSAGAPDLAAIKQRQQATWSSGDYHMIGTQILIVSELLIEALDVHSTERVLDVATGSGNAALAAARRGCTVVGIDYVPSLLERARQRAEAEGVEVDFRRGRRRGARRSADGNFDVVSSVFGAMFAPDQERTASELAARHAVRRPDRPGGPHAGGLHRSAVQGDRARTSRRRPGCARRSCGAPRSGCVSSSATRSTRSAASSGTTSSATARPRRSSTTGGATTARP